MNHPDIQQAVNSINIVHELIYQVFTTPGEEGKTALHTLLTHFTGDFSMTGISGAVADYDTVAAVFTRMQGQKQGAPIETSDYECVRQTENTLIMRYLETQHFSGVTTVRRSVVILTKNNDEMWQWHYLHETPLIS